MTLRFVLPKGAYATTVLDNVFSTRTFEKPEDDTTEKTEEE
jgi:tRNA(Glu) U13 pseudouridine synthase TruD